MGARETALRRVVAINKRITAADEKRRVLAAERDGAMREATAAGATWADLQATGVSKATIAKAVGPK